MKHREVSLSARQDGAFPKGSVHRAVIAVICVTRRAWCLLFSSFVVCCPSCRSCWPSVLLRVCFFVVEICGYVRDLSFFICFCCCCVRILLQQWIPPVKRSIIYRIIREYYRIYYLSRSLPSQVALIGTSWYSKANLLSARIELNWSRRGLTSNPGLFFRCGGLDRKHITANFCCHIDCLTCSSVNVCLGIYQSVCTLMLD